MSDCLTPTSVLSTSSTSLTAPTPTLPPLQQQVTPTTLTPRPSLSDPLPSTQEQGTIVTSSQQNSITSVSQFPRHKVAVLQPTPGVHLAQTTAVLLSTQQSPVFVSTPPHMMSHDGQVMYASSQHMMSHDGHVITLLNASDVIVSPTSPTSVASSPHLPSVVHPSFSSPSPTLTGPGPQYIVGPANQLIGVAPPYSPIPTYPYSPQASPIPSPKLPKMYGSYNAVNYTPSENDSLLKWLKGLRLHKYYSKFENVTFEEVSECMYL